MSLIQQFRDKAQQLEGYADVWILSHRAILIGLGVAFALGVGMGYKLWH